MDEGRIKDQLPVVNTEILKQIVVGSKIRFEGFIYTVIGLPSDNERGMYITQEPLSPKTHRQTPEQLARMLASGRAILVPEETQREVQEEPVVPAAAEKIPAMIEPGKLSMGEIRKIAEERGWQPAAEPEAKGKISPEVEQVAQRIADIEEEWTEANEQRLAEIENLLVDMDRNPFKYFLIDKIHQTNLHVLTCPYSNQEGVDWQRILLLPGDRKEMEPWDVPLLIPNREYAISMSSNGFYLRVINPEEVLEEPSVESFAPSSPNMSSNCIKNPDAKYAIIYPDGTKYEHPGDLSYDEGRKLLEEQASRYQDRMIQDFNDQAEPREPLSFRVKLETEKAELLVRKTKAGAPIPPVSPFITPLASSEQTPATEDLEVASSLPEDSAPTGGEEVEGETWSEEDEEALEGLLSTIEVSKKRLAELDRMESALEASVPKEPKDRVEAAPSTERAIVKLASAEEESKREMEETQRIEAKLSLLKTELEKKRAKVESFFVLRKTKEVLRTEIEELAGRIYALEYIRADLNENPFRYFLVRRMSPAVRLVVFGAENIEDFQKWSVGIIQRLHKSLYINDISIDKNSPLGAMGIILLFPNGFLWKLANSKEVGGDRRHPDAKHEIVYPDGQTEECNSWLIVQNESEKYQKGKIMEFNIQEEERALEDLKTTEDKVTYLLERKREKVALLEEVREQRASLESLVRYFEDNPGSSVEGKRIAEEALALFNTSPLDSMLAKLAEIGSSNFYPTEKKNMSDGIEKIKRLDEIYDALIARIKK